MGEGAKRYGLGSWECHLLDAPSSLFELSSLRLCGFAGEPISRQDAKTPRSLAGEEAFVTTSPCELDAALARVSGRMLGLDTAGQRGKIAAVTKPRQQISVPDRAPAGGSAEARVNLDLIIDAIRAERCLPFLGAGASAGY